MIVKSQQNIIELVSQTLNIPVSYENALVLNETYQNTLHELMENLEISLRENRVRQKELASEINDLEAGRKLVEGGSQEEDLNNPLHIRSGCH